MSGDHDGLERGSVSPSGGAAAAHTQISAEAAAMPALQAEWQDSSSCGARVLGEEVTQRLQCLLSLWKPFCKPVYSGPSRPGKPFSQRPWSQWGLTRGGTLAMVLPIACAIAFIVCKARSVAVRSSFKASWYTWPDSSIPQRSLAWNSWRTAIVCSADPVWPAAA